MRWGERPPQAHYRLGQIEDHADIDIEWLRSRYCCSPGVGTFTVAEKKLVEVITLVLDMRYRAMFELEMPNRLELVHYPIEDWVVAEYLWPQNVLPVLEALKLLRVAALLTYENRRLSTGILLSAEEGRVMSDIESEGELPRLGSWLFQVKSLQRLCDGLHTLFVADCQGRLQGVTDIEMWAGRNEERELPGPIPRAYERHAKVTLDGKHICLVLTPSQEIKVFCRGTQMFVFRGARWHLLDIPAKFADWKRSFNEISCKALPELIFQSAMDLADARHGALFVILDRPQHSLPFLVANEKQLSAGSTAEDAGSRVFERLLLHTLCGADATQLGSRIFQALATIYGALVLDVAGNVLAAGAILRLATDVSGKEPVLEGARSTAATVASRYGLVLKVSEDGLVTCFREGKPAWHF